MKIATLSLLVLVAIIECTLIDPISYPPSGGGTSVIESKKAQAESQLTGRPLNQEEISRLSEIEVTVVIPALGVAAAKALDLKIRYWKMINKNKKAIQATTLGNQILIIR